MLHTLHHPNASQSQFRKEKLEPRNTSLHFLYLILELSQEERQQVLYCVVFAQDG